MHYRLIDPTTKSTWDIALTDADVTTTTSKAGGKPRSKTKTHDAVDVAREMKRGPLVVRGLPEAHADKERKPQHAGPD